MATPLFIRGLLRDQLVQRLRNDVLSGRYLEGTLIRQDEVGDLYSVSRTPVREALIQLKNEGLVESARNGCLRVTRHAPEAYREFLNSLRRAIEIYALQLCFESLEENDLALLDELVERMKEPCERCDNVILAELEVAFQRTVVEKSQWPTLLAIWSLVMGGIRRSFREGYNDCIDIYREHLEIVRRLRSGDREAAVQLFAAKVDWLPARRQSHTDESAELGEEQSDRETTNEPSPREVCDASAILVELTRRLAHLRSAATTV